jgi:hypothetical protein
MGDCRSYGWATLAACNQYFYSNQLISHAAWPVRPSDYPLQAVWWIPGSMPPPVLAPAPGENKRTHSQWFRDSGIVVLHHDQISVIFDAGPLGPGSAGHSHSDTLSLLLAVKGEEWLVDSGTYTYIGAERDSFRGSAAHNTVRIDGFDQATPAGAFRWTDPPKVELLEAPGGDNENSALAVCQYRGFRHHRWVRLFADLALLVVDFIDGPPGEHLVEQFWHLDNETIAPRVRLAGECQSLSGWRSVCYGQRQPSTVLRAYRNTVFPVVLPAAILIRDSASVDFTVDATTVHFRLSGGEETCHIDLGWPQDLR